MRKDHLVQDGIQEVRKMGVLAGAGCRLRVQGGDRL